MSYTQLLPIVIKDNLADAFVVKNKTTGDKFISIDTLTSSEKMEFGNVSKNPDYSFLGSGGLTVSGLITANAGLALKGDLNINTTVAENDESRFELLAGTSSQSSILRMYNSSEALKIEFNAGADSFINNGSSFGIGIDTPDGKFHVHTASAGSVTAPSQYDEAVFENSMDGGITILTPSNSRGGLNFGSPGDASGAQLRWKYDDDLLSLRTEKAGASVQIESGDGVPAMIIDSNQRVDVKDELLLSKGSQGYLFSTDSVLDINSQTSATNFQIRFSTKDKDGSDSCLMSIYGLGGYGQTANRERMISGYVSGNTRYEISTEASGTGTTRDLVLYTGTNTDQLYVSASGSIGINDGAPEGSGLTINQGSADDIILSLKSSDVAHGVTSVAETDTYGVFRKDSALDGGLVITGIGDPGPDDGNGIKIDGIADYSENESVAVILNGATRSGTARASVGNTSKLLSIRNNGSEKVLMWGNGDLELSGGDLLLGNEDGWVASAETDLGVGASSAANANSARDSVAGKSIIIIEPTGAGTNDFYGFSGLVEKREYTVISKDSSCVTATIIEPSGSLTAFTVPVGRMVKFVYYSGAMIEQ